MDVKNLFGKVVMLGGSMDVLLRLEGLYMMDSLHAYLNDNMKYIITSNPLSLKCSDVK